MLSDNPIVRNLVEICAAKALDYVIISPGSRNAPLVISFNQQSSFKCLSIPDERVAAYFALGIGQQTRKPAIITCTSGTAALNFAPAIAEAYYQQIPLLIITADRPVEWIHQGEGQSINQQEIFANYILKSYQLPQEFSDKDNIWSTNRMISEAIDLSFQKRGGPVHINIPFREPLYGQKAYADIPLPKVSEWLLPKKLLKTDILAQLQTTWQQASKKMILCGLLPKQEGLATYILQLAKDPNVIVLSETTSNIVHTDFISQIDAALTSIETTEVPLYQPEILLTIGGSFISKKIKHFLRQYRPNEHWHIGEEARHLDTFQALTKQIDMPPKSFFEQFASRVKTRHFKEAPDNYRARWLTKNAFVQAFHRQFIGTLPWCDLQVYALLLHQLPTPCNLQMGNSTPVRYIQLFKPNPAIQYASNRGVAGIDGSTSTAAGAAFASGQLTILITGDMAFFYDSNAFWHRHLSPKLRIVLINNGGGNIFRFIPGPPSTNQLEEYFETNHALNAAYIAKTYGLKYYKVANKTALEQILPIFWDKQQGDSPALLEIQTTKESAEVLRSYFGLLKNSLKNE